MNPDLAWAARNFKSVIVKLIIPVINYGNLKWVERNYKPGRVLEIVNHPLDLDTVLLYRMINSKIGWPSSCVTGWTDPNTQITVNPGETVTIVDVKRDVDIEDNYAFFIITLLTSSGRIGYVMTHQKMVWGNLRQVK